MPEIAEEKFKKEVPIGKAAELEAQKETLPAVEVKNHVIWVNPDFPELPFDVREGKPTKLGMFLTPKPKEGEKTYPLEVTPPHWRSGIIGRVIFKDKEGRSYRDIGIKGSGKLGREINGKLFVAPVGPRRTEPGEAEGILNSPAAHDGAEMAERFADRGIRTYRVLATISLQEIIDAGGKKITIDEARQEGLIGESAAPVIELRAFGTNARLAEWGEEQIEDTRVLVAQELEKNPEKFSRKEYLKWLAETIGRDLALMHNDGWFNGNLYSGHNITMDGRFTDFDSVENVKDETALQQIVCFRKDFHDLRHALDDFLFNIHSSSRDIANRFISAYEKTAKIEIDTK